MADRYGLEIRSATPADATALADLLGEIGDAVSPRLMADRIEAVRHNAGAILIAVEWGPLSGVVGLSWRACVQADSLVAQITTLLVLPEARRRGVGWLLLKAGARTARTAGCGALQLLAPPGHPDLEAFCRATGFDGAGVAFERALRKRA